MNIKTRFAPSPTGSLHLGNIRTALFNALYARKKAGIFLLRIEDTDQTRSTAAFTAGLLADLQWLGMRWQEGPQQERGHGPYYQSERSDIYAHYHTQLEDQGLAYPCFCTDSELEMVRKMQLANKQPPRYAGTCAQLSAEAIAAKFAEGKKPTLRFRVPEGETVVFEDLVKGTQRFKTADIGDFIIRRADGTAPFLFSNAIDDALMQVTHVLRGDDHVANTPRQLLIAKALQLSTPQYGHLSTILGNDGARLAKRNGSIGVAELKAQGYLPAAIVNYLARLGHHYKEHENKFLSDEELAAGFEIAGLSHSPARFDTSQLAYWQKEAVLQLNDKDFIGWMGDEIRAHIPADILPQFVQVVRHNVVFPADIMHYIHTLLNETIVYAETLTPILKTAGVQFFSQAANAVNTVDFADSRAVLDAIKQATGTKGQALFQPLRVALTGELHGPEFAPLLQLLGKDRVIARLQHAASV